MLPAMKQHTVLLVALLVGASSFGCDEEQQRSFPPDPDPPGTDAASGADLGAPADGGPAEHDLRPGPDGAGPGEEDVGVSDGALPQLDLAPREDGGADDDAQLPPEDAGPAPDGSGPTDGGPDPSDGGPDPSDGGPKPCPPEEPGPEDGARIVLVGCPFSAQPQVDGTEIRSLLLDRAGELHDFGVRLDVGLRPRRVAFSPSGQWALALGEDGELASVRVDAVDALELVDVAQLPSAGYGDLIVTDGGRTLYVVGSNSTLDGGISTVRLGCDGSLEVVDEHFFPMRLAESLALVPDSELAVLCGGQAVFDPVDVFDLRLLRRGDAGWEELAVFDVYQDFVDAARIAVSPDGATVLVPNGSPFSDDGAQLSVLTLAGDVLAEQRRLLDLPDAREALFSPDGATALVTLGEPGRVVVLADEGAGFVEVDRLRGVGLADQMALVGRGPLQGLVLLPSVDPNGGPNVAMLRIEGPGIVRDLGQFELGGGIENIPSAIAVTP